MHTYRKCPDGFKMEKLKEDHAELIALAWEYEAPGGNVPFFKTVIRCFHNVGVFDDSKQATAPIGWCLQYPQGHLAHLFVSEKYRKMGLAKLLVQYMCAKIAEDGEFPMAAVQKYNHNARALFQGLGFIRFGEVRCDELNVIAPPKSACQ